MDPKLVARHVIFSCIFFSDINNKIFFVLTLLSNTTIIYNKDKVHDLTSHDAVISLKCIA